MPGNPTSDEVRATRKQLGLNQTDAAALIGWSRDGWLKVEAGKRDMNEHTWRYWKHVAGVERIPFRAARNIERT